MKPAGLACLLLLVAGCAAPQLDGCRWARIVAIDPRDRLTWSTARQIFDSNRGVWQRCAPPVAPRAPMRLLTGAAADEAEG